MVHAALGRLATPCSVYFALSLVVPVFEVVSYPVPVFLCFVSDFKPVSVPVDFIEVSDMPAAPAEVSEGTGAGAIPVVSAGAPAAPDSGVPGVFCRPPLQAARAMAVIEPIIHGVRFMFFKPFDGGARSCQIHWAG